MRSGLISGGGSSFYYPGALNHSWSSRAYADTDVAFWRAYDLRFAESNVAQSNPDDRYLGMSLRCLVVGKV